MFVQCIFALKEKVFTNISNLKEKVNDSGAPFYINKQLPKKLAEQSREIRQTINEIKDKESELPAKDKSKIEVKKRVVHVNGNPVKKYLNPPEPKELFPNSDEQSRWDKIKLASSDIHSEKGSVFQAFACKLSHFQDVKRAYNKVCSHQPSATHVIGVYYLKNNSGFQDDDKFGSGYKVLQQMKDHNNINTAVFISGVFGGIKLGPR